MSDPLSYISIARKAGSIEIGETNSGSAVRAGKGKLLILASDASDNATSRAQNFVYGKKTVLARVPYTKQQLCDVSGVRGFSMAAFTDVGLASAFMSALSQASPGFESYADTLVQMEKKARQRKMEAQVHDKNKKLKKPAAASASEKRRNKK